MQDEVLAQRIGLIPIRADPRLLRYKSEFFLLTNMFDTNQSSTAKSAKPTEKDTLVFDIQVRCDRNPSAAKDETDPNKKYMDSNVYSGMMQWKSSNDNQKKTWGADPPRPVEEDILLVKLRPGQVGLV
jgi:DNA-directed RNA polymerase I and III subunit RPAC1